MEAQEPVKSFLYDLLLPKIEVLSWALAVIGFVASWCQLHNAHYSLVVGLAGLCYVYMLKAFSPKQIDSDEQLSPDSNQGQFAASDNKYNIFDSIRRQLIAFGSGAIIVGTLFRLMTWEHSTKILLFGEACLLVAILSLLINQRMNKRLLFLAVLGGGMFSIPAETWVHQFHSNDPVLVQKMIYQLDHPRDRAAAEDVRRYLKQKRAQH